LKQAETRTAVVEVIRRLGSRSRPSTIGRRSTGGSALENLAAEATRGGKPQAEAAGRGPEPRQAYPTGCSGKKPLRLNVHELFAHVQASHSASERWSCLARWASIGGCGR
jgi:hypothetical protein